VLTRSGDPSQALIDTVAARDKRDLAGIDLLISSYPVVPIAATAIARGFELISRNRKHFPKIDGLRLESPEY